MVAPKYVSTDYWHKLDDGRVQCDLCPRYCRMREGQRGLCYVRGCENQQVVMYSYGRSSGFCIDPIEKKPLNHFYPGTSVLSLGTAGCNLACKFCQNWDISKSREMDTLANTAMPQQLAQAAQEYECQSVAFTYNDPVIFFEYAVDTALANRDRGIKSVAVSAGYITEAPREKFFSQMDAVNIDLKGFTESFYKKICGGQLQNVLETLLFIKHETDCWLEVTTLLIPGQNDSERELHALTDWYIENLGANTPLHFSAFFPQWKMTDINSTPAATLKMAREIAMAKGIDYVYTGNIVFPEGDSTYCPNCQRCVIERDRYQIGKWSLCSEGKCDYCGTKIAGVFADVPGDWGAKRQVVKIV